MATVNRAFVGIDPGSVSGCIAIIYGDAFVREEKYRIIYMGECTLREWYDSLSEAVFLTDIICVLEKVHGMPGMGVPAISSFMKNVGHIEMALVSLGISFKEVSPQSWMKHYGLKKEKTESKAEWKRRLRECLQRLLPDFKVTNDNADAMLIALYAKEVFGG